MYIIIYIIYILVVFPWVYENLHPYPPKPVPVDAGTGLGRYGCRLPWKTPGLPMTFPTHWHRQEHAIQHHHQRVQHSTTSPQDSENNDVKDWGWVFVPSP